MSSIIFGPILSRRFGKSLGVDLSPSQKQCNFDCLYCELPHVKKMADYQDVVAVEEIVIALQEALKREPDIDFITITANGEPTLYPHLGELITQITHFKGRAKTLILSNGSTIDQPRVQEALLAFDEVKLSLDCASQRCLKRLDRSCEGIEIEQIKAGMLAFQSRTTHPLIIEVLIVKGINDTQEEIAKLNGFLGQLKPMRIDLGTIDRPPAFDVEAVSYEELLAIAQQFNATLPLYIASRKKTEAHPASYSVEEILQTLYKRPLTQEDIEALFDSESQTRLTRLLESGKIAIVEANGIKFYKKS